MYFNLIVPTSPHKHQTHPAIMAVIKLEGMAFYAHHGYYTHEQTRGGNYLIDVSLEVDIDGAARGDDLQETVNYEVIYHVCAQIMDEPCKLIETVTYRIAHEIKSTFPDASMITVTVHKLTPELGGPVHSAQVSYTIP